MSTYQFQVEVRPRYLPEQSAPQQGVYSFAYTITVTNTGSVGAQLISRHWIIAEAGGQTQEVKGLGVVGRQPLLRPGEAFEYTSGCRLRAASGSMHGSYFCVAEDGTQFDCPIPAFALEAGMPDAAPEHRVLH